jgi:hypothetical protein
VGVLSLWGVCLARIVVGYVVGPWDPRVCWWCVFLRFSRLVLPGFCVLERCSVEVVGWWRGWLVGVVWSWRWWSLWRLGICECLCVVCVVAVLVARFGVVLLVCIVGDLVSWCCWLGFCLLRCWLGVACF